MRTLLTFAQAPKRDLQKGKGDLRDLWATKIQFISACMDFQMLPKKLSLLNPMLK
jgi:hypothetical protein